MLGVFRIKPFRWNIVYFLGIYIILIFFDYLNQGSFDFLENFIQAFCIATIFAVGMWFFHYRHNKNEV